MNRKDTIIMAVMVNAVLLITLFISAVRNKPVETAMEINPMEFQEKKEEQVIKIASGDTIDHVLKDFSEQVSEEKTEESRPKLDFAKELEAITKATSQKKEPVKMPVVSSDGMMEVTVASGDSLAKIANQNGTSVEAIKSANHLTTTVLQIGQKLKVPSKTSAVREKVSDAYYTVKQGDNPWTIAVKNQIKVEDLLKLNNLNEEKARRLRPGDRIKIR